MFAYVKGIVEDIGENVAVVDVHDIGYHVNISLKALDGVWCVLVEVVCKNNGIHIVLDKGIEIVIDCNRLSELLYHLL